jgi:electron transport complex protein RnfC
MQKKGERMIKKPFIGLVKPRLEYEVFTGAIPEPQMISVPDTLTLMIEGHFNGTDQSELKEGDAVNLGQKISTSTNGDSYAVATVGGTFRSVSAYTGDFGKSFTAVAIEANENTEVDAAFSEKTTLPSLDNALDRLACLPGAIPLQKFNNPDMPIKTIVIYGGDNDLLVTTNQYIVKSDLETLKNGIAVLKKITGVDDVIIAIPGEAVQGYGHIGAEIKKVDTVYPSAFPQLIMKNVLGETVPAGKSCEELGVCFMTAEAVVSLAEVFDKGQYPNRKLITVVHKAGNRTLVSAVIGTPIAHIFNELGIDVGDNDRIIIGGPMTGSSIYTTDYPVMPDTSAIVVQDKTDVALVSDYPCINCGECVRICPVKVPVNMLVRFLEAGQYEEAEDLYDLHCCIDCGLCTLVCVSKIPIFQFIRLAKYELERMKLAEAANE